MSKNFCGVVVVSLLSTILASAFHEGARSVVMHALDFQGSSVVIAVLMLLGIFCWGEVTRED